MAYTYVGALVRTSANTAQWTSVDVSNMAYATMLSTYAEVYMQVSNPQIAGNLYLDDATLRSLTPSIIPSPTVTAWLASLGNTTLPTTTVPAPTVLSAIGYTDGWEVGYVAKRTDLSLSPSAAAQLTTADMPDVVITRSGVDMANLAPYILVSINGYLHTSYGSANGLCVPHGGTSADLCGDNHFGILSFYHVGEISYVPITSSMLSNPAANGSIAQSAYLTMPTSMEGYVPLLSIGGYLQALDGMYKQLDPYTIVIDTANISIMERIYQSIGYIDLSSLPLEKRYNPSVNPEQFSIQSFFTDATMRAYLTLPQSFVILVKADRLYRNEYLIETCAVPGLAFSPILRRLPLLGTFGQMRDYRLTEENFNTYVYQFDNLRTPQFQYQKVDYRSLVSTSSALTPANQYRPHEARLIEIGTLSSPTS